MTGFEPATPRTPCVCATRLRHIPFVLKSILVKWCLKMSGWQDSNLRPPAPKAGAMTGLRYTPMVFAKINKFNLFIAVRGGFEPPVRSPVRQFSKLVVSATHPSHRIICMKQDGKFNIKISF